MTIQCVEEPNEVLRVICFHIVNIPRKASISIYLWLLEDDTLFVVKSTSQKRCSHLQYVFFQFFRILKQNVSKALFIAENEEYDIYLRKSNRMEIHNAVNGIFILILRPLSYSTEIISKM